MLMNDTGRAQKFGAAFLLFAMVAVVGTALGFEHIGGFIPCKLCLAQREPYYAGIIVAAIVGAALAFKWPACLTRGGLLIIGLLMAYGLVLGIYHAGVEWAFWQGPTDCSTSSTSGITTDASDLLGAIDAQTPPSCDEAAGRFLGLSFAGWNVIASAFLMVVAFKAVVSDNKAA